MRRNILWIKKREQLNTNNEYEEYIDINEYDRMSMMVVMTKRPIRTL